MSGAVPPSVLRDVEDDDWTRDRMRERIGKLAGLAAIVKVGAATASERAELKMRVEAAVTSDPIGQPNAPDTDTAALNAPGLNPSDLTNPGLTGGV